MNDAAHYSTEDSNVTLTSVIESAKETIDLILPDETSILRTHLRSIFGSLSLLARRQNVTVRVVCAFSQETQGVIKEFFPFLQFKSIGSSLDKSRIIVIRDKAEVLFFDPPSKSAAPESDDGLGRAVERFDIFSHPMLVKAWVEVFEGLLRQSEQLEALASEKHNTDFLLDLLSHDIGNHNQILLSLLENVQEEVARGRGAEEKDARLAEMIARARRTLGRNLLFVDNVKKLGMLGNRQSIELKAVDLLAAIEQADRRINQNRAVFTTSLFEEKRLEVRLSPDLASSGKRPWVLADDLLPQIFFNLFSNSLRLKDAQVVTIDVSIRELEIGVPSFWEVSVIDDGPGISDGEKNKILNRFSDRVPGTGLGLAVVAALIRRYGGEIWINDRIYKEPSKGVVFGMVLRRASTVGPK